MSENIGKLRILIIRNAQPYDFGGGERFPVDLSVQLATHGFRPIIVSRSPKLLAYAAQQGVPAIRGWWWPRQNWSGRRILLTPIYYLWLLLLCGWYVTLMLRLRPDIVHAQSKDDFIAATIIGKLLGKRIIWTDHADLKYVYANHPLWYKNPVGKLVAFVSRWADAITLVSHSEEGLIAAALGLSATKLLPRYQVIHNGVIDQAVEPAGREAADSQAFIFCATSRLVTAKGIGELIRAFTRLQRQHQDIRLWLVGDGPEAKHFKLLAGDNPRIVFHGHVDMPLPSVAACDVFVHPSYHEGFSISLIEAAMLAKPIIACDVGGNGEIVRHNQSGLLIPARDADALYRAMKKLYDDRQLATRLGRQARANYEKDFRFEKIVADRFIPLYVGKTATNTNPLDQAAHDKA